MLRALAVTALVLGFATSLFAAYAILARWVWHGPLTSESLFASVQDKSGSAGDLFDEHSQCERVHAARTWRCDVADPAGSGAIRYRVVVRQDEPACWDATLSRNWGEGGPQRISGCIPRWDWSLLDVLV
jgi:hypothetical protein